MKMNRSENLKFFFETLVQNRNQYSKPPGVGRRPTLGGPKGHPQGGFLKKWQNSDLRTRYRIHHLCPYDGSKFGDVYFLSEFRTFYCNSCSALGFKENVFLRPPINSIFSARQN